MHGALAGPVVEKGIGPARMGSDQPQKQRKIPAYGPEIRRAAGCPRNHPPLDLPLGKGDLDMRHNRTVLATLAALTSAQPGLVIPTAAATGIVATTAGCSATKIWVNEKLGHAKREQLVTAVESARDQQEKAKETFASALDEFLAISAGDQDTAALEAKYRKIESAYKKSKSRAKAVNDRIANIERVANALFKEWNKELDSYSSDSLRAASEQQLQETKARYEKLVGAMHQAAGKMDPVLAAFQDQTLFLKHNLNARAIASLDTDLQQINSEVTSLIQEMEASIAEANAFIEALQPPE